MDPQLAALVDDLAIRRRLAVYCQCLDDGRWDEWVEVFAADVRFVVMGMRAAGRDEVRAFVEPTQHADARGRHMLSEPVITVDGDGAVVTVDFAFLAKSGKVLQAGRYHDTWRREPDAWRIATREIVFVGDQPVGFE